MIIDIEEFEDRMAESYQKGFESGKQHVEHVLSSAAIPDVSKCTGKETGSHGVQYYVEKILQAHGITYRRSNSGFAKGIRIGSPGFPDFDMWLGGGWVGVEVKGYDPKGKPTRLNENQALALYHLAFREKAPIWVVHTPEQFYGALVSKKARELLVAQTMQMIQEAFEKLQEKSAVKMARKAKNAPTA